MVATTGISPAVLKSWPATWFAHLLALYSVEPWGAERDNMHAAMLASMYAGAHTAKGKPRPKISDFMFKPAANKSAAGKLAVLRNHLKSTVKR